MEGVFGGGGGVRGRLLEVVVVCQLLPGHDALVAGEEGHAWLAGDGPLRHAAVGRA